MVPLRETFCISDRTDASGIHVSLPGSVVPVLDGGFGLE